MAMTTGTVLFFASTAATGLICFMLVRLRIGEIRDSRMKNFFPLCIATMGWIMLNAAINVVEPAAFAVFYTARMCFACMIPYLNCWFFLNFSESRLVKSHPLLYAFIAVCTADILAVLTNPMHRLYFITYDNPFPQRGILAVFHVATLSAVMVLSYAVLFPYIVKNLRRYPLLLLTGFGAVIPYALYMVYAMQIIKSRYDLSPLGFFFSVIPFAYFSYASRMVYSRQDTLNGTLEELTRSSALSAGVAEEAAAIIAEKGCRALHTTRIGIWAIEGTVCKNITTFSLSTGEFTVQDDLDLSGNGRKYLDRLASERLIAVGDTSRPNVLTDVPGGYGPQTCALLDSPIRVGGKLVGVICVEQDSCKTYPERREWLSDELNFVSSLADFMEIAIISSEHHALAVRNENIMANMPGAIYQCLNNPPEFTVTFVSPGIEDMTGYVPEELIGGGMVKLFTLLHPDDAGQLQKLRGETLYKGLPMESYFRVLPKDGGEKWIWERSKTVKTAPDGRPLLFEGFYTDISEQRRREAADAANEAKSAFLAQMSHEMRTPLSAVLGLSELLLENGGLSGENEVYLDRIYNAGSTMLSIINDILDISKIEAGKFEIIPQVYAVPGLINDVIAQNILRIHSKPVRFILDISESTPARLRGDDIRVRQIVSNLLSNAFKYTDNGTVELKACYEREGDSVWTTFRVSDTGIGIRPEDLGRLFTDYSRFDGEANRKIGGTGLGLSITKRLAELMGGNVTATSEYGKGSVFTAKIRQGFVDDSIIGSEMAEHLRNFEYVANKRRRGAQLNRVRLPCARVLVVDDNPTNLEIARGLMQPYEMEIDCVTSGQESVDAIREEKHKYNAIFMDHMMPGMDGVEAVRIIREEIGTEYAKTIPVIALTANAVTGNKERFISQGFNDFVSKPIDIFRLDEVIRKWIWDRNSLLKESVDGHEKPDLNDSGDRDRPAAGRPVGNIGGLDWPKGVKIFGNEDTYRRILRSFALSTGPLLETMAGVDEATLAAYAVAVHGIKGASRGVCAFGLGDMAESLEFAAKDGNLDFVRLHNPGFLNTAYKLIKDIQAAFEGLDTPEKNAG